MARALKQLVELDDMRRDFSDFQIFHVVHILDLAPGCS